MTGDGNKFTFLRFIVRPKLCRTCSAKLVSRKALPSGFAYYQPIDVWKDFDAVKTQERSHCCHALCEGAWSCGEPEWKGAELENLALEDEP